MCEFCVVISFGVLQGMAFIHVSPIRLHGRLSSSNCVVDARFILKLTDFGLPTFYDVAGDNSDDSKTHHFESTCACIVWLSIILFDNYMSIYRLLICH